MTKKQFYKLKVGSIIKNEITDEEFTVTETDELGVVLSDGYYYMVYDVSDFVLIKK